MTTTTSTPANLESANHPYAIEQMPGELAASPFAPNSDWLKRRKDYTF
jgi:hypothetical protein